LDACFCNKSPQNKPLGDIFMSAKTFTLLVAHGSRDERWKQPFQALIQRIKTASPDAQVDLCYMEMTTPTADDVLANVDVSQLTHFQILPLFMAAGAHVAHEIEEMKLSIAQRFAHLSVEVLPPIGEHPLVQDAFETIILKTL
jgi:sirohydrochlorin cobaltochelatase